LEGRAPPQRIRLVGLVAQLIILINRRHLLRRPRRLALS
jgi:hypothetical protein